MTAITWPSYTNDDGTYSTGTIVDATFLDAVETEINALVHSTANPTVTPVDIIDEVVAARGSIAALDTFLDVEHNNDGTHNLPSTIVTSTVLADSMAGVNLLGDPTFMCWPNADTAAPAYYALSGSGAVIDRAGTGQTDTKRKIGEFCAKLTRGSADLFFSQQIWQTGDHAVLDGFEGTVVGAGAWVFTSTTNTVRVYIEDGDSFVYSGYPTAGVWTWLSITKTISSAATKLLVGLTMAGSSSDVAYLSGITAVFSDTAPGRYIPAPSVIGTIGITIKGQPVVGDGVWRGTLGRPGVIKAVSAIVNTNPTTGGGLDFDFEVYTTPGTSWISIWNGAVTLDVNDETYWSIPSPTAYNTICLQGHHTNSEADTATRDQLMRLNIDDAALARDVFFQIRILQWNRPLDDMLEANSIEVG